MNRRGFLGAILALGAAPAIVRADSLMRLVPKETTLLVGETFTIEGVYGANGLLQPWMITREVLRIAHENVKMIRAINRTYDHEFAQGNGRTIRIRVPNRYARSA